MKYLPLIWIGLLALTVLAWMLGHRLEGAWLPLVVLGLAAVKGQLVIDHFMELKHAPRLLRYVVSSWLIGVLTVTGAIGWLA